jgi:hypothetical protein
VQESRAAALVRIAVSIGLLLDPPGSAILWPGCDTARPSRADDKGAARDQ